MKTNSIETLSKKISDLFASIKSRARLMREEQIEAGRMLMELRDQFAVKNKDGVILRGPQGGSFCAHVAKMGWNLGTCYHYMSLADPKMKKDVSREAYWQSMNRKFKKATPVERISLLKESIAHLVKLYDIDCNVTVTRKYKKAGEKQAA